VSVREREFAATRSHERAERAWLADARNVAWLAELDAAIDSGDLDRLAAAQGALRLPPAARGPLPGPVAPARELVPAQGRTAVPFRQVAGAVVEEVALPEVPARRLFGAFARRAGGDAA
jgi:hypothetical protein